MKLKSLRLRNMSCFEDIIIDLCHEKTGEPCKWVVLLGENGTGKSTILQLITTGLHRDFIYRIANNINFASYIRDLSKQEQLRNELIKETFLEENNNKKPDVIFLGNINIECQSDSTDKTLFHRQSSWHFHSDFTTVIKNGFTTNHRDKDTEENTAISRDDGWFIGGYGPNRSNPIIIQKNSFPEISDLEIQNRFGSIFSSGYITNAEKWISELYFKTIHPNHSDEDDLIFQRSVNALNSVLLNAKFKEVNKDGEVIMEDMGSLISINRLSDGNKSTLSWVLDLTRRLCDAFPPNKFPDLESPLHAPGVVLVDEIDLHLHPKWQRKVVEMIRKTFPNIQFIVTTHSPFVAQDMTENDKLIVLKRGNNGAVQAEHGMGFAKRWRADQILTSWLFDLETTRDGDADQDEKDYQALLRKEVSEKLTDEEKARMRELNQKLNKDPLGETLSDQEIYAAADALAHALLNDDRR